MRVPSARPVRIGDEPDLNEAAIRSRQCQGHMPHKRRDRFFSLHRLRSILCVINNLGILLAAHGQPDPFNKQGI